MNELPALTNVERRDDGGRVCLVVGAAPSGRAMAVLKRLEQAAWIGDALDSGRLSGIDLRWCDSVFAARIARWKEPLARVPLTVRTAPQLGDDGLAALLALPQLVALELEPYVLRHPSVRHLADRPDLQSVTLPMRTSDPAWLETALAAVPASVALVRV